VIITRTPVRVSLLGGGTDFVGWARKHGGIVVGGAVNKYSFVTARFLPPFHEFKTRLVYREIETVNSASELNHRAARAVLESLGQGDARLEVFHAADLPGRSGTGSSSTFVVGMLHAVGALGGKLLLPHELAERAIHIERNVLGETGGLQDQVWAAYGGLNVIHFRKDGEIDVRPMPLPADHVRELEDHLLLFFTRVSRTSSEVAATYAPSLVEREGDQFAMMRLAEAGAEAVHRKRWETLGNLVDQSWRIKAGLSASVNPPGINKLYLTARVAGAWGGKLTGAGGGGCMVLVAPPEKQPAVVAALTAQGAVHVPFRFDFGGSQIIFSDKDNLNEYRPA
jgi:D-glycero-alpha-D-manno-heptose-7-phosphate kinase